MGKRGPNCSSLQTGQGWAAHHKPTQKLELRDGRCYLVSFCVCFFACSFGCIRLQATVHINYMFSLFLSRYMLSVYRKNSLLVWIFGHEIFILCNRYNFGGWKGQNGFLCFVFFFLSSSSCSIWSLRITCWCPGQRHIPTRGGCVYSFLVPHSPISATFGSLQILLLIPSSCPKIQDRNVQGELSPKGWFCPSSYVVLLSEPGHPESLRTIH